jgi:hypothetical protein
MNAYVKFTRVSSNSKTGPIPVTMTESSSCPSNCPLKGSGCYAETGMVALHWRRVSKGEQAGSYADMLAQIQALPRGTLWRMNVAGDLLHNAETIDASALEALTSANKGRKGFTYTHHRIEGSDAVSRSNWASIDKANTNGFTVNLSANSLEHADTLAELQAGPVVSIVPIDHPKLSFTPAGRPVVVCPAVTSDNVTCSNCGLCQNQNRRSIVAFPVHGSGKKKAERVFMMARA